MDLERHVRRNTSTEAAVSDKALVRTCQNCALAKIRCVRNRDAIICDRYGFAIYRAYRHRRV